MEKQSVTIEEVKSKNSEPIFGADVLEIEWFESKKQKLTRKSQSGIMLELRLEDRKEWHHGDRLYSEGSLYAILSIKKCLVIQFVAKEASDAVDFCYFIGNRHLPLFVGKNESVFLVPYDGLLYEQLSGRYQQQIELADEQLIAEKSLRYLINRLHYEI